MRVAPFASVAVLLASTLPGCGVATDVGPELPGGPSTSETLAPLPAVAAPLHFQLDPTRHPALPDLGSGVAIADYDADGDLDIAFALSRNEPDVPAVQLLQNDGTGVFTDVTTASGLGATTSRLSAAVVFVDVDGDGILDLFVTRRYNTNLLFLGQGPGTFVDVSGSFGFDTKAIHDGASFADLDLDGDLDVHIATSRDPARDNDKWEEGENGAPDFVFRNEGDHFVDATEEFGLAGTPHGETFNSVVFDVDGDFAPDLFKVQDFRPDAFYRNDGKGHFTQEVTWVEDMNTGLMGIDVADIDGDGQLDIYSTNWGYDHVKIRQPDFMHKRFIDMSAQMFGENPIPSAGLTGWGCALSDLDNDTDLDVVTIAGFADSAGQEREGRMVLIENLGLGTQAGTLIDRSDVAGEPFAAVMHGLGLSTGDLDGDGDLDVVVGIEKRGPEFEHAPGLIERSLILWNVGGGNTGHRALEVELAMPSTKNRFGIGSVVRVTVGGRVQTRVVLAGSSHLSSIGPRLHFGLGTAEGAEKVEVTWPDGAVSAGPNVPAGFLRITRP